MDRIVNAMLLWHQRLDAQTLQRLIDLAWAKPTHLPILRFEDNSVGESDALHGRCASVSALAQAGAESNC